MEDINYKLELSRDEMRKLGYKVIDTIVDHLDGLKNKPVSPSITLEELMSKFDEPIPEKGIPCEVLLENLKEDIFKNNMFVNHPRFLAFVPSPGNYISVLADALTSAFNPFCGTYYESPAATIIEKTTINW